MWELMNGMTNGLRDRVMPRRRNGMGTMTAMVIGASVGIAAWETMRRSRITPNASDATKLAQQVMDRMGE